LRGKAEAETQEGGCGIRQDFRREISVPAGVPGAGCDLIEWFRLTHTALGLGFGEHVHPAADRMVPDHALCARELLTLT
jgi:hypothetical protein